MFICLPHLARNIENLSFFNRTTEAFARQSIIIESTTSIVFLGGGYCVVFFVGGSDGYLNVQLVTVKKKIRNSESHHVFFQYVAVTDLLRHA